MNKFDVTSILESETFNKKGIELDLSRVIQLIPS